MKTTLFLIIALMTSGSSLITEQDVRIKESLQEKKINLLEKLEKGTPVASEEIRASFGDRSEEIYFECPLIITQDDLHQINESLSDNLEKVKTEIGCLRHSEEFIKAMEEVKRGKDEIKMELEKIFQELKKAERSTGVRENS